LCFHNLSQVFILRELEADFSYEVVTGIWVEILLPAGAHFSTGED